MRTGYVDALRRQIQARHKGVMPQGTNGLDRAEEQVVWDLSVDEFEYFWHPNRRGGGSTLAAQRAGHPALTKKIPAARVRPSEAQGRERSYEQSPRYMAAVEQVGRRLGLDLPKALAARVDTVQAALRQLAPDDRERLTAPLLEALDADEQATRREQAALAALRRQRAAVDRSKRR